MSTSPAMPPLDSPPSEVVDWIGRKVGLVDLERKDFQQLAEKISMLPSEEEWWASKYEELRLIFEPQQSANLIASSELIEKRREVNLTRALAAMKLCVTELEKALHEMNKHTSKSKLAEVDAILLRIEGISSEINAKLHAAEAKLAGVNRKTSELEIRLGQLEARESVLLTTEHEAHKEAFYKQIKDLQEWEKKLLEWEERLLKRWRIIHEREEKADENERILEQRERDLEESWKKIDSYKSNSKENEDEEADWRNSVEGKLKELRALEEKPTSQEKVEIHQLLDEHRAVLDTKMQECELDPEDDHKALQMKLRALEKELIRAFF